MKKRIKLLFSLMAFCVALASLIFGVYAAQTFSYEYNGSMSYNVSYGFLQIETSVYKYNKKPLTSTQAQAYYDDLSELILVPEYSHSYSTYDANNLLKGNVENQTYNLNFDYDDGYVFFIVVNVKSLSTEPIKATLSSNHNIANSWSHNSGNTVILKNDSGENIIFCNGITDMFKNCEGSFSYNIDFDIQQSYTPTTTGTFSYSSLNSGISSFSKSFDKKTEADDFSKTESFEISPSQLVNDGSNYAVVFNFVADDFFYDQVFDFRFKNIRLYKSTGDVIDDIMIKYSYITGGSLTNLQSLNSLKLTTMPQKCSLNVTHLKEGKAAIIFVINDSGFSSINRVAFDIEINMTEKVERNASNVDYEYKITLKLDETIAIMPGKNTSKNVETMEFYGESYDIVDAPNYVVEARVSINNIRKYIEDYGRYAIPTMEVNPDFYGNVLVWIQTMLLLYVAEGTVFGEIGYLPIPIEDVTLPIDDSLTLTFLRNDWATNIGTMIMLANSVSIEELTYLASQYLTPIPADMDESINIPFQIGSLKNIPVEIFMTMYEVIESVIGTGQVDYDIPIMELGLLFEISMQAEMFRQSPEGPESFGLSKNFRLAEFITMQQSGMLDDADPGISMEQLQTITVDYIFFVPGTTFNDFGGYRITECYYESVDVVVYNADSTALDLYALPTKAYKTDNSNLFVDDGVLYTKDKTLAKYPSLKPGGMYEVLDGTKTIEANAFSGSKNLSRVTVPKSVETIDKNAFRNSSVSILYVNREMVNNYTMELVDILNASNVATLYVMLDGYVSDVRLSKLSQKAYCRVELLVVDNQSGLAFALGDGGAYVSGLSNRNVEYVVIPSTVEIGGEQENVTRIGQNAFKNCLNLKTIEIPSTITTIGDDAFMNCPKLTELYFDAAKIQEIGTGNLRKGMSVYTTDRSTANIVYSSMENAYCVEWGFYTNEDNFIAEFDYTLTIGSRSFKYNGHYNKIEADNTAFRQFVIISMETDEEQLITFHEKASTPLNDNNDILGSFTRITKTPKGSNTGIEFIGRNEYIEYEGNSVDNFYPETGLGVSTQTDCWIYINLGLYITEVS